MAVVPETQIKMMQAIAQALDDVFNPGLTGAERKVGFAMLVFNLGEDIKGTGRVNYIGNSEREDIKTAMKELVARWEGRVPTEGGKS